MTKGLPAFRLADRFATKGVWGVGEIRHILTDGYASVPRTQSQTMTARRRRPSGPRPGSRRSAQGRRVVGHECRGARPKKKHITVQHSGNVMLIVADEWRCPAAMERMPAVRRSSTSGLARPFYNIPPGLARATAFFGRLRHRTSDLLHTDGGHDTRLPVQAAPSRPDVAQGPPGPFPGLANLAAPGCTAGLRCTLPFVPQREKELIEVKRTARAVSWTSLAAGLDTDSATHFLHRMARGPDDSFASSRLPSPADCW